MKDIRDIHKFLKDNPEFDEYFKAIRNYYDVATVFKDTSKQVEEANMRVILSSKRFIETYKDGEVI